MTHPRREGQKKLRELVVQDDSESGLVDPRLRASNDTNDPSKLARYFFRDGG